MSIYTSLQSRWMKENFEKILDVYIYEIVSSPISE